jgi:hypothetical protein
MAVTSGNGLQATVLSMADRCAGAVGWLRRPLRQSALLGAAERHCGLSDYGDASFQEPLALLLRCYAEEADLSVVGRLAARWDAIRFMINLLRLREEERTAPSIREIPVSEPIVITGLPRSGTTFLHTLLAEDASNLVPRYWQTVYPYPLPHAAVDRRMEMVEQQLRMFARLAPDFPKVHPIAATSPQECSEITAHVFRSLRFDTTHTVPSYRDWLDGAGHTEAYKFHKRFLQHLLHQEGPKRCVVKCPDHIFAMPAIREIYPDARYVFVHRDPARVLASVARLTEILRQPFSRRVDRLLIGRQEAARWAAGAALLIEASEARMAGPGIFHVLHTDLVGDPIGTVAAMYRHFGIGLSDEAKARMVQRLAAMPSEQQRHHTYRMQDFGLDPEAERRRFADYIAHFEIETEAPARARVAEPLAA